MKLDDTEACVLRRIIREYDRRLGVCRTALTWYADRRHYTGDALERLDVYLDGGTRALNALTESLSDPPKGWTP